MSEVDTLQLLLKWFEFLSGLKINFGKCELIGVRTSESEVISFARAFGCKVGKLPSKYIGMPLCVGLPWMYLYYSVVERIEKKLSS